MRIAVTTGLLPIPPTYFVVQHAIQLGDKHEFGVFTRAADVQDSDLSIAVDSAVPPGIGSWKARQYFALASGRTQARRIRAFQPDLVHQHFATWMQGPVSVGGPLLTTLHGYDVAVAEASAASPLAVFHRRNVALAIAHSTRFLAVSQDLANRAVAAGFPSPRLEVHYQGIDTDFFAPAATGIITDQSQDGDGRDDGRPVLVFVGALARRKGLLDLLRASIRLSLSTPHVLRVVGVGPLEAELASAATQHPHIEVIGSQPREGIRSSLRGARALVLPTQRDGRWREAAGLVLLEAQACGTPAIAYASGGTPEMLRDGDTGLLVPEFNEKALRDAMHTLLTMSDNDHRQMSDQARKWVVSERSLASSAEQLDALYSDTAT